MSKGKTRERHYISVHRHVKHAPQRNSKKINVIAHVNTIILNMMAIIFHTVLILTSDSQFWISFGIIFSIFSIYLVIYNYSIIYKWLNS